MPLLRLNEHYTSVQGEGPRTGILTQFVRFSGCNMRCPGWPCDTLHAVLPELYRTDPKEDSSTLVGSILREGTLTGARNVCITGGEPFMQDHTQLRHLTRELLNAGMTIDIFTNGSFIFPNWVKTDNISVVMDWKLSGSGEATTRLDERRENATMLQAKDGIKFVVKDQGDLDEALQTFNDISYLTGAEFWVGRAWDTLSDDGIVNFIKLHQLPWRLNVQLHKYLWPNVERGI